MVEIVIYKSNKIVYTVTDTSTKQILVNRKPLDQAVRCSDGLVLNTDLYDYANIYKLALIEWDNEKRKNVSIISNNHPELIREYGYDNAWLRMPNKYWNKFLGQLKNIEY